MFDPTAEASALVQEAEGGSGIQLRGSRHVEVQWRWFIPGDEEMAGVELTQWLCAEAVDTALSWNLGRAVECFAADLLREARWVIVRARIEERSSACLEIEVISPSKCTIGMEPEVVRVCPEEAQTILALLSPAPIEILVRLPEQVRVTIPLEPLAAVATIAPSPDRGEREYARCVAVSERVAWRIDDILGPADAFNLCLPLLPESLAMTSGSPLGIDRLRLNHITASAYLGLFAFAEDMILETVKERLRRADNRQRAQMRALSRFVDEEGKHQLLFERARALLRRQSGAEWRVVEDGTALLRALDGLCVGAALAVVLHIELTTQHHYVESVRAAGGVDPLFATILRAHWTEEAQHACIDLQLLLTVLDAASPAERAVTVTGYLVAMEAIDRALCAQVELDIASLDSSGGHNPGQIDGLRRSRRFAYRKMFVSVGLQNATLRRVLCAADPTAGQRMAALERTLLFADFDAELAAKPAR